MTGDVRPEPALRTAMAGFAADAIGNLELYAAHIRGNIVGMTVEALLRLGRRANSQIRSNALAEIALEHRIGLGVLIVHLPGQIFVLKNAVFLGCRRRAMARTAGACCDTQMNISCRRR